MHRIGLNDFKATASCAIMALATVLMGCSRPTTRVDWYLASRTAGAEYPAPATLPDGKVVYRAASPLATQADIASTSITANESTGRPILVAWLTPRGLAVLGTHVPKGTGRLILTVLDGVPTVAPEVLGGSGALMVASATSDAAAERERLEKIAASLPKAAAQAAAR